MKVLNKLIIAAVVCAAAVGVGTCSPWEGYIVSLGGSGGGIDVEFLKEEGYLPELDEENNKELEYTITLTDGKETKTWSSTGSGSFEIPVGIWDIKVEAAGERIRGVWKEKGVKVYAGTEVEFLMENMALVATRVSGAGDLKKDIDNSKLKDMKVDKIEIAEGFSVNDDVKAISISRDITLYAEENVTISKEFTGSNDAGVLFLIRPNNTLTLDGSGGEIILNGGSKSDNRAALINVYGTLNMYDGVTITNNYSIGAAQEGGIGGGVWVSSTGTFNMKGGIISRNTASSKGGGVYVVNGGFFEKTGGIIYGYNSNDSNSNKIGLTTPHLAGNGHAVYAGGNDRGGATDTTTDKYKDSTAGTGVNLTFNKNRTSSGAWDNNN